MIQCSKCGIGQNESAALCTVCGTVLNRSASRSTSVSIHEWEQRDGSLFVALWKTAVSILKSPTSFFQQISPRTKTGPALLFYILLSFVALPATMLMQNYDSVESSAAIAAQIIAQPLAMVVFGVAGIYIGAGFLQLLFMITGIKKASYRETALVLCYTNAPMLLMLLPIPYLPILIVAIWAFILQIIGTAMVHRCSVGKMAVIQIIPLVISMILLVLLIAMIVFIAVAAGISVTDSLKIQDILDLIR